MNMKQAVFCLILSVSFVGCEPAIWVSPPAAMYRYADPRNGTALLEDDAVYLNAFGIPKSRRMNQDVMYVGNQKRQVLLTDCNEELLAVNGVLLGRVNEHVQQRIIDTSRYSGIAEFPDAGIHMPPT